jgi:molybdenum cofactor biosynthesis protein A
MSLTTKSLRLLRRPRFPSLLNKGDLFSSNAALLDDETEDYPTSAASGSSRPRLESLRQQLRTETESNIIPPPIRVTKTEAAATEASSSPDLEQILRQLEDLPMPQEPLQDRFGRQHSYLRISLSEKCNLRCLYCMPEDGVPLQPQSHLLSNAEILRLASWFVDHGVTKVRLTGGEPLLRKDLLELVHDLNTLGGLEQIGMTTNGVTLSKQLPDLVEAGLSHVNISLDSLDADKFARLTRRPPSYHKRVLQAIEDCARLLPHRTKINCVVMPENVDELEVFCELTRHMPIDVRFIEYMPFNDNQWGADEFVSYQDMQDKIQGLQRIEDGPNDTTKWWTLDAQNSSSLGRIGFITSMSEHFCGTCNRLRITADGQLKVCLFGKTEVSLRDLMRQGGSDEALEKLIHYSVQRKHFKLGGHEDMEDLRAHSDENRPMTLIGG